MKTKQYISENGRKMATGDTAEVYNYGPMVVNTKDIGKETKQMSKEN